MNASSIATEILNDIHNRNFSFLPQLPPEQELAKHYTVSRARIREALAELSYKGVLSREKGRGTFVLDRVLKRSLKFALVFSHLDEIFGGSNSYYGMVFQGMKQFLGSHGYETEVLAIEPVETLQQRINLSGVSGVVIPYAREKYGSIIRMLSEHGIATVVINANTSNACIDHVYHDNLTAGALATRHLLMQGCRNIAFVGLPEQRISAWERFKGYKAAIVGNGLALDKNLHFTVDEYSEAQGYLAGGEILKRQALPDGIFAVSDFIAVGIMKRLLEAQIKIPQQVKIIGYGNYDIGKYFHPGLSTINITPEICGSKSVELLLEIIEQKDKHRPQEIEIPVALIERQSTIGVKDSTRL